LLSLRVILRHKLYDTVGNDKNKRPLMCSQLLTILSKVELCCCIYDALHQVPANHLLSASFMSAPAALAISKLLYPETKKSYTTAKDTRQLMPKG